MGTLENKSTDEGADSKVDEPTVAAEAPPEKSMFEALLLAFFGGMLLNIMPCVLPVLSLKLFSLVEQSDITSRQQKDAGLVYSGGIIASFLVLAIGVIILQTSFGLNVGWGFQFQYPGYVIGLATIVFVFGLSLLGVFEVPAIGANKASEMSQKEGWLEYFMIGVFATPRNTMFCTIFGHRYWFCLYTSSRRNPTLFLCGWTRSCLSLPSCCLRSRLS